MKKMLSLLAAGVVAGAAAVSGAQPPAPMPDPVASAPTAAAPVMASAPVDLYKCVKYRHVDDMACCAKPMIVEVRDPCWRPDPCNPCCKPASVKVQICVPDQCCPPTIKCSKDGKHVHYDFGKYDVCIRTRTDHVEVSYQD